MDSAQDSPRVPGFVFGLSLCTWHEAGRGPSSFFRVKTHRLSAPFVQKTISTLTDVARIPSVGEDVNSVCTFLLRSNQSMIAQALPGERVTPVLTYRAWVKGYKQEHRGPYSSYTGKSSFPAQIWLSHRHIVELPPLAFLSTSLDPKA